MFCPPVRRPLASVLPVAALGIVQVPTQRPAAGFSFVEEVLAAVLLSLVVGGGLILLAPGYTDRATVRILEEPADALLYGLGIGVVTAIVLAVLLITVVGIVLAVPLTVVVLVFSEIGYLAVGRALTDNWIGVLLVAMAASAVVVVVPVLGALLGILLSSFGIGAAYLEARSDTRTRPGRSGGDERSTPDR